MRRRTLVPPRLRLGTHCPRGSASSSERWRQQFIPTQLTTNDKAEPSRQCVPRLSLGTRRTEYAEHDRIFGASGDLTSRKLIPSLYGLFRKQRLPQGTRIVGFARTKFARRMAGEAHRIDAQVCRQGIRRASWQQFAKSIFYHPGDIGRSRIRRPKELLDELEQAARRRASIIWPPQRSFTGRRPNSWASPAWPTKRAARGGSSSKSRSAPIWPRPAAERRRA